MTEEAKNSNLIVFFFIVLVSDILKNNITATIDIWHCAIPFMQNLLNAGMHLVPASSL